MEDSIVKNSRSRYSPVKTAKKTHQKSLDLSGYNLKNIPKELFEDPFCFCLENLDLSNNDIEKLPSAILSLKSLKTLVLSGNKLCVLAREIKGLTSLTKLDLSRNKLSSICEEVNFLKNLEEVNLSGNQLINIPIYLLSLPRLRKVFCIRNETLQNIPREVAARGLQAMRGYLNVKVENYECFTEEKAKQNDIGDIFNSFLVEIEKDWTLDQDQYTKRTKDACIGPEFEESDLPNWKMVNQDEGIRRTSSEKCLSNLNDANDSGFPMGSTDHAYLVGDSIANASHSSIFGDVFLSDANRVAGDTNEDRSIENLVKIFHKQIDMVSEHKADILLKQERRQSSRLNKCLDESLTTGEKIPSHTMRCNGCGLKKKESLTSEYGTLSTCSRKYSLDESFDNGSCDGNDGSIHEYLLSDCEAEEDSSSSSDSFAMDEADVWSSSQGRYLNASKELVVTQCGIQLTIPEMNLSGHKHSDFAFEIVSVNSPQLEPNAVLASPIVHAIPHGAKFYSAQPAIVKLPLNVVMDDECALRCFTSDTDVDDIEDWKEIDTFEVNGGFIFINANHFSLFCAAVAKDYPHIERPITASEGGSLVLDDVPGLEVSFSNESLEDDITATMTALYDDSRYVPHVAGKTLASPVVALGPSGRQFSDDVTVTLPLPNARGIFEMATEPGLTIMQSQTGLNEKPRWTKLDVNYEIIENDETYSVSFKVRHFTLFSSFWNTVGAAVDNLKRQVNSFMPDMTYLVYFQALMGECNRKNQFGLYVFCHRKGEPPVTDCNQYQIQVGKTSERRLKTGEVTLRLKSSLFVADELTGESEDGLIKTENFTGFSFDKQFTLQFREKFNDGPFGKVYVSSKDRDGKVAEVLDFNLERNTERRSFQFGKETNEWESNPVKEMAGLLSIDNLWKELGLSLGYTRSEINRKFTDLDDPIGAIQIDFKSRGGEARKFIDAMYKVSRTFKLLPFDQMMENRENRRIENRIDPASSSRFCDCPPTPEKSPLRSIKRKLHSFSIEGKEQYTEARLDSIAEEILNDWKRVGCKLGIENRKIAEIDQNNRHENEREKAFQMLITWREKEPEKCCPETLCDALRKCQLNYTAQRCSAN